MILLPGLATKLLRPAADRQTGWDFMMPTERHNAGPRHAVFLPYRLSNAEPRGKQIGSHEQQMRGYYEQWVPMCWCGTVVESMEQAKDLMRLRQMEFTPRTRTGGR